MEVTIKFIGHNIIWLVLGAEEPQLVASSIAVNDNDDDDTDLLLPSEIDVKMAPKLLRLQFPRVDEGIHV